MKDRLKRIGLLTSGGDAPGMNAAIRAVVRNAVYHDIEVYGIRRGYQGMIDGDIYQMQTEDVANIIQRGGTILKTVRSKEFMHTEGRKKAYDQLVKFGIEALVVIGGDGTFRGASLFFNEYTIPAVGLPGTIDKDLTGSDSTIGFDTAVNTAVSAIDKIRETAESHDRLFIVEVMGRHAGYIAIDSGIACGAEEILIPESTTDIDALLERLDSDERRKKSVHIIIVAEGKEGDQSTASVYARIKERFPLLDIRLSILGHIQRGGPTSCADRILASRLGYAAVEALMEGKSQVMLGLVKGEVRYTPFESVSKSQNDITPELLKMIRVLSS